MQNSSRVEPNWIWLSHSSHIPKVIAGDNMLQVKWKVDQKFNQVKLESVLTLLKITRLALWPNMTFYMCGGSAVSAE